MKNALETLRKTALWIALCVLAQTTLAVTLEDLRHEARLTPQKFASYFANFNYAFHAQVQRPEVFLATETGDCDDYATLAAQVLKEKGYSTRLISVRMAEETHVVCYVAETKCYLDFNSRVFIKRTVASDGSLEDIAKKVAKSFDAKWTSVAEFTYANGFKRLVNTVYAQGAKPQILAQM